MIMNKTDFVEVINLVVLQSGTSAIKKIMEKPPGSTPQEKHLAISAFYHSLNEGQKTLVELIVNESARAAVFNFLCVLDGVVAIENENKGVLKLYYENNGEKVLLNNSNEEFLHDLLGLMQ